MLETLAASYGFSPAAVKRLAELYSDRVEGILASLRTPARRYFLRVNTLKATPAEVVEELRRQGFEAHVFEALSDAIFLPVKGPFYVRRLEKTVVAKKEAAESVYQGAHLYAPGVLNAKGVKEGERVNVVSPRGDLVAEGVAMMDGEEMVARKQGLAVRVEVSVFKVPSIRELDVYRRGLVYDQSLPAIVAGHVLDPKPDWLVVDMCASPGGKATHAAQLMGGSGRVVAVDRSRSKVAKIEENARRLGLGNIEVRVADSRYLDVDAEDLVGSDAVILDPPCSALGVRPNLYYERGEREFQTLSEYQRQFLRVAARLLRKGGLLLYSTCTLTLEENELNVLWAVKELGFKLRSQPVFLGSSGFAGLGSLVQRFEPDIHDSPGFFIALLEKV
ncbi:MAG: RsmB/NOP family class I SAM-dependent RNA methyltransferase [Thermofilaceae archaeon]